MHDKYFKILCRDDRDNAGNHTILFYTARLTNKCRDKWKGREKRGSYSFTALFSESFSLNKPESHSKFKLHLV